jgi:hypothetical protein
MECTECNIGTLENRFASISQPFLYTPTFIMSYNNSIQFIYVQNLKATGQLQS